jgi:hypothetical protein
MRLPNKMIAEYRDLFHARDLLAKSLVSVYGVLPRPVHRNMHSFHDSKFLVVPLLWLGQNTLARGLASWVLAENFTLAVLHIHGITY